MDGGKKEGKMEYGGDTCMHASKQLPATVLDGGLQDWFLCDTICAGFVK